MNDRVKRPAGVRRILALGAVVAAVSAVATVAPVSAQDVEREKRGDCTGSSRWELSLEKEYGRIDVDLEIDTTRRGRAWSVVLRQNGTPFVNVRQVTDVEGEIDLGRMRPDQSGEDRFRFRAVDQVNGEVCSGVLKI